MPDGTDERVRVPLNGKIVDLAQLKDEVGGVDLVADATEVVVAVEGAPLTAPALAAAVAAHVPLPRASNRDALRQRAAAALDGNAAYLASASPTNAQVAAQVRLLTREATGIIRLLLDRVESIEGT